MDHHHETLLPKKRTRPNTDKKGKKKPGAQPGHPKTNTPPKMEETITHEADHCPDCDSRDLSPMASKISPLIDFIDLPKILAAYHEIITKKCNKCGKTEIKPETIRRAGDDADKNAQQHSEQVAQQHSEQVAQQHSEQVAQQHSEQVAQQHSEQVAQQHSEQKQPIQNINSRQEPVYIPSFGIYGINVICFILYDFLDRLPFRRIKADLARSNLDMSVGAVHGILHNTGDRLEKPSKKILKRIRKAIILCADETSISLNGVKVWIWTFYDPLTGDTYYVIRNSRGANVVQEVLGKNWEGIIVCDGWVAYARYKKQRCWAHILRANENLRNRNSTFPEVEIVLEKLKKIHRDGHDATGSIKERRRTRDKLRKRAMRIVNDYQDHPILHHFMTTLGNACPNLFVYVLDDRVPSTNNAGERSLRELVVHRKIRGCIRSTETMQWMANIFTCTETWKSHGLDMREQLMKYI